MKILIIINDLGIGGAQRLVVSQANELVTRGYQVAIVTLLPPKVKNFETDLDPRIERVSLITDGFTLKAIIQIRAELRRQKADFIFSHLFFANTLTRLALLTVLMRTKCFVFEHNVYDTQKTSRHYFIDILLLCVTTKVIAVSEEVKKSLESHYIPKKIITIIENGIKVTENIDSDPSRQGVFVFLAVGHVIPQKGHDLLYKAAKNLTRKHPGSFVVKIVGPAVGEFAEKLMLEVRSDGQESMFQFLGPRTDVPALLKSSSVFIMPSRFEGLSIALLEALSSGIPTILSDLKNNLGWLVDGESTLMHKTESSESLEKVMDFALKNPEELVKIGKAGKYASRRYNIERNTDDLERLMRCSVSSNFNISDQSALKWQARANAAVEFLDEIDLTGEISIADLGCGDEKVRRLIEQKKQGMHFRYQGYDIQPQYNRVIPLDVNTNFQITKANILFALGLIEYVDDIDIFLAKLKKNADFVILSSVVSDNTSYTKKQLAQKGWKQFHSEEMLHKYILDSGFRIVKEKILDNGVTRLFLLMPI